MNSDQYCRAVPLRDASLPSLRPILYLLMTIMAAIIGTVFAAPTLSLGNAAVLAPTGFICLGVFLWQVRSDSSGVVRLVFALLALHVVVGYGLAASSAPWIVSGTLDDRAFSLSFVVIAAGLIGANAVAQGVAHGKRGDQRRSLPANGPEAFSDGQQHDAGSNDFGHVRIDVAARPGPRLRANRYFHEPTPRKMIDAVPSVISSPFASRRPLTTGAPSTKVPFRLPKSSTYTPSSRISIRACKRLTRGSSIRTSALAARPTRMRRASRRVVIVAPSLTTSSMPAGFVA